MRIIDDAMLAQFRGPGVCNLCGRFCAATEPHHVRSRGAGGSDIRINLLRVGSTPKWECRCHSQCEAGTITAGHCRRMIAEREHTKPDAIVEATDCILRLQCIGKGVDATPTDASMRRECADLSSEAKQLVMRALSERSIKARRNG